MMTRTRPVVAIDGPVGAGKSTVARALARALGFDYLNTGAMYRAVAVAARYINVDDSAAEDRLEQLLDSIAINFDGERVLLDGKDVTAEISQPVIGDLASRLSTRPVVRARLRKLQRAAGEKGGVVIEGRDIGTAIFPDAEFKFFLTAGLRVRAARRFAELAARGVTITEAEVLAQLEERDRRDQQRELAPLRQASDAILIDSSELDVEQVVRAMLERVLHQAKRSEAGERKAWAPSQGTVQGYVEPMSQDSANAVEALGAAATCALKNKHATRAVK